MRDGGGGVSVARRVLDRGESAFNRRGIDAPRKGERKGAIDGARPSDEKKQDPNLGSRFRAKVGDERTEYVALWVGITRRFGGDVATRASNPPRRRSTSRASSRVRESSEPEVR